jgi:hypothetical protein
LWVGLTNSICLGRTAGIGAFDPLLSVPAKVCLLNPKQAPNFGDGNGYSCPFRDIVCRLGGGGNPLINDLVGVGE